MDLAQYTNKTEESGSLLSALPDSTFVGETFHIAPINLEYVTDVCVEHLNPIADSFPKSHFEEHTHRGCVLYFFPKTFPDPIQDQPIV